jgi:iron complex outermembrane receptor protein
MNKTGAWRLVLALLCWVAYGFCSAATEKPLAEMSLEELSAIRVTSVSGRPEPVARTPASIYVITAEDIRRSSATTLAEALRLAPNLIVARFDAGTYGISARGFNSNVANKLLVLVDGRTIYSPLFSGVFWESNDVMLEDVERIEVISGSAGSQWGTNAVNGVVNVITRSAADTRGSLVFVQGGNRESAGGFRYGGHIGQNGTFRVYGKAWQADDMTALAGPGAADRWRRQQAGFRSDWSTGQNRLTLQGDVFSGSSSSRVSRGAGSAEVSGVNVLGRWNRLFGDGSELQFQAYYENSRHEDKLLLDENGEVWDLEAKYFMRPIGRHRLQWGAGYRHAKDQSEPGTLFAFIPAQRTLSWTNIFLQDQIRLSTNLSLTLGTRFESNTYTGWEILPNVRLGWTLDDSRFLWTAVSRAVRAPSRVDREIFTPPAPPFIVAGGPDFVSEVAKVFELGYRAQPARSLSYSITYYYQRYDHLKSAELTPVTVLPITAQNKAEGSVSGVEAWGSWQVLPSWRLSAGGTTINSRLRLQPGSTDPVGPGNLGNNPDYQFMLRSVLSIGSTQEFDVGVRRVGALPAFPGNAIPVPGYTAVDLRYAWRVSPQLELALVAQNAFDPFHREWGDRTSGSEIGRSLFVKAVWRQR